VSHPRYEPASEPYILSYRLGSALSNPNDYYTKPKQNILDSDYSIEEYRRTALYGIPLIIEALAKDDSWKDLVVECVYDFWEGNWYILSTSGDHSTVSTSTDIIKALEKTVDKAVGIEWVKNPYTPKITDPQPTQTDNNHNTNNNHNNQNTNNHITNKNNTNNNHNNQNNYQNNNHINYTSAYQPPPSTHHTPSPLNVQYTNNTTSLESNQSPKVNGKLPHSLIQHQDSEEEIKVDSDDDNNSQLVPTRKRTADEAELDQSQYLPNKKQNVESKLI